jgi:MFS family permease
VAISLTGRASLVILVTGVFGLIYGAMAPAVSSMIGLESPRSAQGRVFGASSSSISVGFAAGPLLGGAIAASAGVQAGLAVAAAAMIAMSAVMALKGREPRSAQYAP